MIGRTDSLQVSPRKIDNLISGDLVKVGDWKIFRKITSRGTLFWDLRLFFLLLFLLPGTDPKLEFEENLMFHFIFITYREVALQPQLIFRRPLILQEFKISKILQKSIYNC